VDEGTFVFSIGSKVADMHKVWNNSLNKVYVVFQKSHFVVSGIMID
jgi:hypothetical protein